MRIITVLISVSTELRFNCLRMILLVDQTLEIFRMIYNKPFTFAELLSALRCALDSSPGADM